MGMLVEGRWLEDDEAQRNAADGSFVRPASQFRHAVTVDGSGGFPAEPGRYHLFIAPSCPWAHRTAIMRRHKQLDEVVGLTLAELPREQGWVGSNGIDDLQPVDGRFHIHRLYTTALPDYTGRVTVPVLWDRKPVSYTHLTLPTILRV